jgi:DNA repair protein RecO (recombination protein O)
MAENYRAQIDSEPAFILHTYAFRETSLIVETFSRHHGRVAVVARGARRPKSALRGQLMAFQPLLLAWSGQRDPKLLTAAEWQAGMPQLVGLPLLCAFYLNELLLKLLQRDDAHERLFDHYEATLRSLTQAADPNPALRRFEMRLLQELGYGLSLSHDARSAEPLQAAGRYMYDVERGPVAASTDSDAVQCCGKTLLDMAADDFSDPVTVQESKQLLRTVLRRELGDKELKTRQLLKELQAL